jgi:hypothetical protein
VVALAPRISHQLIEAVVRFDDRAHPIAETCRRVGAEADRLGLTRPSYERIRVLVHEARRIRRAPTTAELLRNMTSPLRTPDELIERLQALGVRPIVEWRTPGVPK